MNVAPKRDEQSPEEREKAERGKRFKEFRKFLKLTQEEVAERSGALSRPEVSNVETGANQLNAQRVVDALARGYGAPTDVIIALRDNELTPVEAFAIARNEQTDDFAQLERRVVKGALEHARGKKAESLQVRQDVTQRERQWLALGLRARGIDEGPAYRIAYTIDLDVGADASPEEILEAAHELALREKAERKGKVVGDRAIRARQSPSGTLKLELPDAPQTQPPKHR